MGGLSSTLAGTVEQAPDFLMGRVIQNGLTLLSSARSPRIDAGFRAQLEDMRALAERQQAEGRLTERERLHAEAVWSVGLGKNKRAVDIWQDILVDHPTDILAVKFMQVTIVLVNTW